MAGDETAQRGRKPRMSAPKKIDSEESRKRLIERLNETEKFLGPQSPAGALR